METSDGSFAWTDASSDSSKDDMVSDVIHNKSKQDSDKDEDHENKSHGEAETVHDKQKYKERQQKKYAVYDETENNNTDNQTNKSIKSEPNSDFDVPKIKEKHKRDETGSSSDHDESLQEAEDYLNLRVKQEQMTFVEPTPRKRTKKKEAKEEPNESEEERELCMPFKDEIDIVEHDLENSCLVNGDHSEISEIDSNKKKKKKKKEKLSMDSETSEILEVSEDKRSKAKKKKKKHKEMQNAASDDDSFQHDTENGQITSSTLIQENYYIQENGREHYNCGIQSVSTLESGTVTKPESKKTEGPVKKTSRISDRIRFEEDSIDYEPKEVPKNDISIQLEHFISSSVNLKPLQADLLRSPEISDDDDVWILKVPHDIAIGDLKNTNLTFDSKKKVNINGNTYDTVIDTTVSAAPILLFNERKVFIKNTPLKGVINLRKRIPKINISYESLMTNTESSFIPLPDTKCRHPLFGAHYKKAAKVPRGIAERLKPTTVPPNTETKKKKKHKVEIASDIEVKPDIEELHSSKKKRKLKQKLDTESDIEEKPHFEVRHSKKNKRRNKERIESDSEVKPNIELLHSKKQKSKSKNRLEVESVSELKPSFEVIHSKKKKRKSKEKLECEFDTETEINSGALHSNKKKRKHSDESIASKKAKRVKYDPTSADAWESEQAIEKNLFDF